jgi:ribosome recycling factor
MNAILFVALACMLFVQATNAFNIGTTKVRAFSRTTSFLAMEFDWKVAKKAGEDNMGSTIDSIQSQLNTIRTGGANPNILDRVMVEYYGSMTPLNQIARVAANGASQLIVEPFDKASMKDIESAIALSDLNLNPNSDGAVLRINIPMLTEDRRKELVKKAKSITEDGKVAIRNHRRDVVDLIKKAEKDKDISKDDNKDFQDDFQKSVDKFTKKLETMMASKEKDLLKI